MKYKIITLSLITLSLIIVLTLFLIIKNIEFNTETDATINFEKNVGEIKISYGSNEDSWWQFTQDAKLHNLHKDVNSKYIRVWILCTSYMRNSMPYDGNTYDFIALDDYINAVFDSDATPFIVFANGIESCGGEAHGNPPPSSDYVYADYVETVVKHFNNNCDNNLYSKPCNIDDWYFEVWNEPYHDKWWEGNPPRFSVMFNIIYSRIKAITSAKIGGPTGAYVLGYPSYTQRMKSFLINSKPDFISIHHYGNMLSPPLLRHYTEAQKMEDIKLLFHDSFLALRQLAIQSGKQNIEIVNSEYSSDSTAEYMPHLDEPFTATWYASALINQIKSQEVDIELFYSGTSALSDGGFGMWNFKGVLFPSYYMKKSFVKYNKKGSSIFDTVYDPNSIDILAVENNQGRFITLVNKRDKDNSINLAMLNVESKELVDLNSQEKYSVLSNTVQINLKPYEIKFLQVIQE